MRVTLEDATLDAVNSFLVQKGSHPLDASVKVSTF